MYMAESIVDPTIKYVYQGDFGETVEAAVRPIVIYYEVQLAGRGGRLSYGGNLGGLRLKSTKLAFSLLSYIFLSQQPENDSCQANLMKSQIPQTCFTTLVNCQGRVVVVG